MHFITMIYHVQFCYASDYHVQFYHAQFYHVYASIMINVCYIATM